MYLQRVVFVICMMVLLAIIHVPQPIYASEPDVLALYQLVQQGEGDAALALVTTAALERGGWGPAPGDIVVYDPQLPRYTRGKIKVVDQRPVECESPRLSRFMDNCDWDLQTGENFVTFGVSLFSTPQLDGSAIARQGFDDLLSTYIEEVGHSWQEYLYETEGRGSGERTRVTSYSTGLRLGPGWEYQIKIYLLTLDGTLLKLSTDERTILMDSICRADGYANPTYHDIPPYGPPPGWPAPEAWPTTKPSDSDLQLFCEG